ncbi:MAG: cytochrome c oxidase subunit 3 [Acetobacteraceae bacterium]|nr:cytochrome c oxidase subunit 3 [Acetobacteraceae bacterium]
MSEEVAPHVHFQYANADHQAETAIAGMWLFLATEVLFFGGLILVWLFSRHWQQAGFDAGGRETILWIGTLNLVLLITSSFTYSSGLAFIEGGDVRRLIQCCWVTAGIGGLFLILKFTEWYIDIDGNLFPSSSHFKIHGPEEGGARLFWTFYFVATILHALHMTVGIAAVGWMAWRARKLDFTAEWHTPVEVVGLYWSFVDIVWITLYPLIYLVGRGA